MRNTISKAVIAGLTALSLTGSLIATTEAVAAADFHGGRAFHGGGFHGGGFHGGELARRRLARRRLARRRLA